jgi:hypothetical protein
MPTPDNIERAIEQEKKRRAQEKVQREFPYMNLDAAGMRKSAGDKAGKAYVESEKKKGHMITPDTYGNANIIGKKKEAYLLKLAKSKAEKGINTKKPGTNYGNLAKDIASRKTPGTNYGNLAKPSKDTPSRKAPMPKTSGGKIGIPTPVKSYR